MKSVKRIIELLDAILHQLELANWQRSGGKGPKPGDINKTRTFGDVTIHVTPDAQNQSMSESLERQVRIVNW